MLARRIIAVSSDKAFGKQLAVALKAAGGAVDLHQTLDELGKADLQAALLVLHLDGPLAHASVEMLPRLTGDTRVIAILPRTGISAFVELMQSSERVAGLMVADQFDSRELSAMATRVLAGDIFGLDKMIQWGTQIHSTLVGDYQEKSLCISHVSEFAEQMGVRRKYRESIEQCLDEMLMNALYDAPVDEHGKPIFTEIPTKTRMSLRVEQKAIVQYACDGKRFAVSVRDAFGTLERATVLRYLYKCLHSDQQIDRKAGGAGLGLYLMTNAASDVFFNVLPGVATEATCIFDLEATKLQLNRFGFFTERIDAAGRLASGPSRRLPAGSSFPVERRGPPDSRQSRGLVAILVAMIAAIVVLIGITAWPRLFGATKVAVELHTNPKGAMIEIDGKNAGTTTDGSLVIADLEVGRAYPVTARLEGYEVDQTVVQPTRGKNELTLELKALAATTTLDSQPPGASVELDGKPLGTTPFSTKALPPATSVTLTFRKTGYRDANIKIDVPGPGKETRVLQTLTVSEDLARVKLLSDPSGAQIMLNGQLVAGAVTPAEILVEAGKSQSIMLTMPHRVPAVIDPFVPPHGADGIQKTGKLVEGTTVSIDAVPEGKVSFGKAPHCQQVMTPFDCILIPGAYAVEYMGPGNARAVKNVVVTTKAIKLRFELGFVEAATGKLLQVGAGPGVKRAAFDVGPHRVTVTDDEGTHVTTVNVRVGTTVIAQ